MSKLSNSVKNINRISLKGDIYQTLMLQCYSHYHQLSVVKYPIQDLRLLPTLFGVFGKKFIRTLLSSNPCKMYIRRKLNKCKLRLKYNLGEFSFKEMSRVGKKQIDQGFFY